MITEPVTFGGGLSARQTANATRPEKAMVRKRMPAMTIQSDRKVAVARLEEMTAGRASSVTSRLKTGW